MSAFVLELQISHLRLLNYHWTHQQGLLANQKNHSIQFRLKEAMTMKKRLMMNTRMHHEILKNSISQKKREPMFHRKGDKYCYGSMISNEDHRWLYFSQSFKGWMCTICEIYPYSSGSTKGAFSTHHIHVMHSSNILI